MSKVATYLRGHLLGDVDYRGEVCQAFSKDAGVLKITPEVVVAPQNTNDIRKVARFSWQLAEKGHILPLTARGNGQGTMGGAINKGIILSTARYMNSIFEYDAKQRLIRVQPGITAAALNSALSLHGTGIMALDDVNPLHTIGGAISANISGAKSDKYGDISGAVDQLEVVLANGDVLQTSRLSKREVSQKKGLQTLEGDIYRGIDRICDEYADVIADLHEYDKSGYSAIADVKRKDGSIDLAPLFVGASGSLGIISEMILKVDFRSQSHEIAAITCYSLPAAHDVMDMVRDIKPAFAEYFDAELFNNAIKAGKTFDWYDRGDSAPRAVILVGFDDFNSRARARSLKKLQKACESIADTDLFIPEEAEKEGLSAALRIARFTKSPDTTGSAPEIYSDIYIPSEHYEAFVSDIEQLAKKLVCVLPMSGHVLSQIYSLHPRLSLDKIGDKQKLLKLLDELAKIATKHSGALIGGQSEGRLAARFANSQHSERVQQMYAEIKEIFDPFSTLNPGAKQNSDIRALATIIDGAR